MSLFTQRLVAQQEAAARTRNEMVDALIDEAPAESRQQLVYAINRAASWPVGEDFRVRNLHRYLIQEIRQYLREEYGVHRLAAAKDDPGEDLAVFILNVATTRQITDVIDAVIRIFADQITSPGLRDCAVDAASGFAETVSRRMKQHRLAYDLVEFKVVEKRSEELHAEVVAPALTLLHGRSRFAAAERQYRNAIDELAGENWADAITDATGFTALADMRNEESDAHGNSSDTATAWLALHWAGALIVYLVQRAESLGM